MATIFYPDGRQEHVEPQDGESFSLEQLQSIIGGLVEVIDIPDERHILICDEEGKIKGLPRNSLATRLVDLWPGDYIAGPALVCLATEVR